MNIPDDGPFESSSINWGSIGTLAAGEVLTVTARDALGGATTVTLQVPSETTVDTGAIGETLSHTAVGTETSARVFVNTGGATYTWTCSAPADPEAAVADAPSPPIPAWVQAYGRDKSASCKDGWDASWQEWAEPITGGWVCARSIPSLG